MSAQLEEERKQYEEQLELVFTGLKDDPENAELLTLKEELDQMIKLIDDSLADLKPPPPAFKPAPKKEPTPPRVEEKWSRENHPAFKKAAAAAPPPEEKEKEKEPEIVSYQVNDNVLAKWVSGDKAFYPARITSVTGSSTAPIYTVKFKSYDTVETLRAKDIRPVAQKRKADGSPAVGNGAASSAGAGVSSGSALHSPGRTPAAAAAGMGATAPSSAPASASSGIVLSAAADLYPQAQGKADEENPKKKFKKIKATKELEAGKSKWQEFSTKGKFGKSGKKDSMFRTPEGIHGRVGFTGSGQAMRKDPTRSRHIYQQNEELD